MKHLIPLLFAAGMLPVLTFTSRAQNPAAAGAATSAGPVNGGLRMKLSLHSSAGATETGVAVEIINVSGKAVTLRAAWEEDDPAGDLKDYIEAAISIETTPAIQPWSGQVAIRGRSGPQPELTLKAGESLSVKWITNGKSLKNRVSNPLFVQNPKFPQPGLYGVRASLAISTGSEPLLLRSNEQLFASGGSVELPKATWGQVREVDDTGTAIISPGSLEKVAVGDQFRIRTGYSEYYRLSITKTEPEWAVGVLFPEPLSIESSRTVPYPKVGHGALLATDKLPVPEKPTSRTREK